MVIPRLGGDFARNAGELADSWRARRKEKKIKEALSNYQVDPESAIAQVMQADPVTGWNMAGQHQQRAQQNALFDRGEDEYKRGKYLEGLKQVVGTLKFAAQDPNGDVGATFDSMTPLLTSGYGLTPEQAIELRTMIVNNPGMLKNIEDAVAKVIAPGGALVQQTPLGAREIYRNPYPDQVGIIPRGDGGRDVVPIPRTYGGQPMPGGASQSGVVDLTAPSPAAGAPPPAPPSRAGGGAAPLTVRTNNPGAIKDGAFARGQRGYKGSENGFAVFETPEDGARAQTVLLDSNYIAKGYDTPRKIVEKYAPRGPENSDASVNNYITHISRGMGIGPDEQIPTHRVGELAQVMAGFEAGIAGGGAASGGGGASPYYTTPGKPEAPQWRTATLEEKQAAGVDTNLPYQISPTGEMRHIGPAPRAAGKGSLRDQKRQGLYENIAGNMGRMEEAAAELLRHPGRHRALGAMSYIPNVRGGAANDFIKQRDALTSQIGFAILNDMRQMSPTGGALGNVSNFEVKTLQRNIAALEESQSVQQFEKNVRKVITYASGLRKKYEQAFLKDLNSEGGRSTPSPGQYRVAPRAAQDSLRANPTPERQRSYDEYFGPGSAARVLGRRE